MAVAVLSIFFLCSWRQQSGWYLQNKNKTSVCSMGLDMSPVLPDICMIVTDVP